MAGSFAASGELAREEIALDVSSDLGTDPAQLAVRSLTLGGPTLLARTVAFGVAFGGFAALAAIAVTLDALTALETVVTGITRC